MKRVVLIFLILISYGNSARILGLFLFPSKSHHILGSALLKELAKRGHEVTMMSPYPLKNPPERYEDVHLRDLVDERKDVIGDILRENVSMYQNIVKLFSKQYNVSRKIIGNEDLHRFLKQGRKYDLVIHNAILMTEALYGVGQMVNATTIGFSIIGSSMMQNYYTGNPSPYSYVPCLMTSFNDEMNFSERLVNTIVGIAYDLFIYFGVLPHQRALLKEFFPNSPPLDELIAAVDMTLVNSHIATETPRPYLPSVIQIGGFHLQEKEILPAELERFLNASKRGVIYFSLGTNAKYTQLPIESQRGILEAFRDINYDVLWVYDGELQDKPVNVKTIKWAPQRAVLAHKNVKVFITHAGLGSSVEAIYFGKPMICIPLFGDQYSNAADNVAKGYAISVNKDQITKEVLVHAIKEIVNNPVYKHRAELMSDVYRNQEVNPMDKAVFWVEHVIKHKGAKHLRAKAADIPLYQYFLLDVFAFIFTVLLILILVLYYILKTIYRLCCCKSKKVKVQ